MYTVSKQLTPPTCITHSLKCHFTSTSKLDLLLVKGNILFCYRIYTTKTSHHGHSLRNDRHGHIQEDVNTARLELLHEFTLQGIVTSLDVVRTTRGSNKDSLLLTFHDAKMSLIEYSVFTQNLATISMHNYEREEFKRDIGYKGSPKVRVDYQSRCAILHFYKNYFAILPFKTDSSGIGGGVEEDEETRKYPFHPSYVETELEKSIKNVLDFKFLYGYLEPTVAILYEPVQTFVGRLAHRKDTVSLIVISLDLHQRTYPVLYKVEGLPYNCTHIESVPAPLGGVLIFSHNAIIHLDQTHTPGFAAIVNPFFDMESHFKATPNLDGTPVIPVKNKPPSIYVRAGKTSNCKELGVSLDGSHSTFLSPDIVLVILKTGEMLQVDLIGDDNAGRSWKRKRGGVKDIKIKKLGLTTSSPSCITPLADFSQFMKPQILSRISVFDGIRHYSNYFFVGSIVSDAMLIQYFQPIEEKMHDGLTSGASQDVDMLDEELDEELYGGVTEQPSRKDLGSSVESSHFKFKVCDSILVTGPIRNVAVGKPAPYTSNEYTGEPVGAYLEVVACGGYDAHGSLLVMHETVRPQIISSFPLGDADDIWSVRVSATKQAISEQFHKYLVISRGSGTSILRTGEELEELENSGFYVEGPTVCVGTALNESVIIQVYPNGVIILSEDGKRLSETSVGNDDVWIVSCFLNDPYAAILLNTGELQLFLLSNSNNPLQIEKELKMDIPIACIALYTDDSPVQHFPTVKEMDARPIPKGEREGEQSRPAVLHGVATLDKIKKSTPFDEEDMDLYGDALVEDLEGEEATKTLFEEEDEKEKLTDIDEDLVREAAVKHWCFVVDDAGTLRILSLPDLKEKFIFYDFRLAPRFVYDHVSKPEDLEEGNYLLQIDEIVVVDLGSDAYRNYPYIVVRSNKADVFVYRIIPSIEHTPGTNDDRISIRMVRLEQNYISREPQAYADAEGDKLNPIDPPNEPPKFIKKMNLIPFDRIGVEKQQLYSGVMVTGARPLWIMMEYSGVREGADFIIQEEFHDSVLASAPRNASNAIRIHPMNVDGPISSFAPIHNINIPFGFAYINGKGLFRLCQLSPHFSYDRHWPVCKVPLGRSAHKIAYHSVSETYVLGTSTPTVFEIDKARYMAAVAAGVIADGEELPDSEKKVSGILDVIEDREPGMYLPEISAYQLELISPVTWETVDIIKMSQFEQILSLKVVELASKENTSGKKLFVAVGTGFMRSEDLSCRGRLLVFDVIDVVPEPGRPQTNHKLKPFFSTDEKNPVTSICGCNGYLLAAIGTKVLMYAMEDGELNGVAFLDVSIFVVSLSAVKNFVVIGDAFKSVWFVVFQEDPPKLVLLGKDLYPVHTFGCDIVVSDDDLGIVVSDDQNNLHVLTYEPDSIQSLGGQRLLRRGEINLGYEIQAFAPVKLKAARAGQTGIRTGLVSGTSEGGLSMVVPIGEKLFKRLYGLYSRMVAHLEHHAGLNPRGFRQIRLPHKSIHAASFLTGPPGPRGILDGDLLNRFLHLPLVYQRELAKAIGSKDDRILDDLLEISITLEYF